MVSSILLRRCVTVCAVVVVWSLRVVRVDAIAVVLEPTSEHTLTQRAKLGFLVVQSFELNLHPVHPLAVLCQLGITHLIILCHFHEH